MTNSTSDGGTVFKTLPGERPRKVRAMQVLGLQKNALGHRIVGTGSPDHRVTTTPNNRDRTATHTTPLNDTSAEAAAKKRFP